MKKAISALGTVLIGIAGGVAGGTLVKSVWLNKYHLLKQKTLDAEMERDLLYIWFLMTLRGISITEYFIQYGYESVAVLGMQRIGRRAVEALDDMAIYAVEADNFAAVHERLTVWRLGEDPLPEADVILVTDLERVSEKLTKLRKEFFGDVVTLAEVLRWLLDRHEIKPRDGSIVDWPPPELLSEERE